MLVTGTVYVGDNFDDRFFTLKSHQHNDSAINTTVAKGHWHSTYIRCVHSKRTFDVYDSLVIQYELSVF